MNALHDPMTFEIYYDQEWLSRDPYFAHHRRRFLQTWDAVAALGRPAGRVLDVGGVGPIAHYLARLGWETHGSDVDLRGPLPLPAECFDLALCTEVIEHIKDVDSHELRDLEAFNYSGIMSMLREMRRTLRTDGVLLVTTPNASSWHMLSKWLYGELPLADPQHVREFTLAELGRVATACGLQPLSLKTIDSWNQGCLAVHEAVAALMRAEPSLPQVERGDNIVAVFARA